MSVNRSGARILAAAAVTLTLSACTPWVNWRGQATRQIVDAPNDQAAIDAGNVVNWSGCWPGDGCTVVLAGHRTTHGGVFRRAADLQPGDEVLIGHGGTVHRYEVTSHDIVCCTGDPIEYVGDLMLFTSASGGRVHVISATRT